MVRFFQLHWPTTTTPSSSSRPGTIGKQIDGVENALDQDLSNDHRRKDADDLADPSRLTPIDLVEGVVHLAENVAVAFGEIDGGQSSCSGGLGRLVVAASFVVVTSLMRTTKSFTISASVSVPWGSAIRVAVDHRCHTDLAFFCGVAPEEGCALLMGQRTNSIRV